MTMEESQELVTTNPDQVSTSVPNSSELAQDGKGGAPSGRSPRPVPIDWEALEDAFENNASEVHSYLHLRSGEVLRVVDGVADPQMHARIAADATYIRVEPVSSREQYRWMERFIQMLAPTPLRDELALSIDGRGAFRRFKDVLMVNAAEREQWFSFRSDRLRVFVTAWLEAHDLAATCRAEAVSQTAAPDSEPGPHSQSQFSGRRSRNAEWLRAALVEVAQNLGARDLDRVLSYAEFVKSRRVTRSYSQRQELEANEPSPSEPASDPRGKGA